MASISIADLVNAVLAQSVADAVAAHVADTTAVHGIADTNTLYRVGGTDVAIADGGTGASTAAGARTNLDVQSTAEVAAAITAAINNVIAGAPGALNTLDEIAAALADDANLAATITTALAGKQPLDTDLSAIAALTSAANKFLYATGTGTWALADVTAAGRALLDDASVSAMRSTLDAAPNTTRQAIRRHLESTRPFQMQIVGDSTGNDATDWPGQMVTMTGGLAELYPDRNFWTLGWSDALTGYDTVVSQSTGALQAIATNANTTIVSSADADAVTGDIDITWVGTPTTWSGASAQCLCSRFGAAGNRAWRWYTNAGGTGLVFEYSTDGTALISTNFGSPASLGLTDATETWLRVTLDINNGAGASTLVLYRSTNRGATWTQLATANSTLVPSLFSSTVGYQIGGRGGGTALPTEPLTGTVAVLIVRSGILGKIMIARSAGSWTPGMTYATEWTGWTWNCYFNTVSTPPVFTNSRFDAVTYNSSVAGSVISYADSFRYGAMSPQDMHVIFVNYGHNEGSVPKAWQQALISMENKIREASPAAPIVMVAQNPQRTSYIAGAPLHLGRIQGLMNACHAKGWLLLNVTDAFLEVGTWESTLMTDDHHPTLAGHQLWAGQALSLFV